jgi:hypothetical protein
MTPILSNRARQQTPKPGSSALRASLPRIQLALFEHIGIKPVAAEQVMEVDAPIEEVLCAILSYPLSDSTDKMGQESSSYNGRRYSGLRSLAIQIGKSTCAID